jgi:hypothetical protein
MANCSRAIRLAAVELMQAQGCSLDRDAVEAKVKHALTDATAQATGFDDFMVATLVGSALFARELALDDERTVAVLIARAANETMTRPSRVCSGLAWAVRLTPDGRMLVEPNGNAPLPSSDRRRGWRFTFGTPRP